MAGFLGLLWGKAMIDTRGLDGHSGARLDRPGLAATRPGDPVAALRATRRPSTTPAASDAI